MDFVKKTLSKIEADLLVEKIRSKTFKWNEFKELGKGGTRADWIRILKYIRGAGLQKLGQGSSRVVYVLSSRHALKVAHHYEAGAAQNKVESDFSDLNEADVLFARVHLEHPKHLWVVTDLVKEATDADFQKRFGLSGEEFVAVLDRALNMPYEEEVEDHDADHDIPYQRRMNKNQKKQVILDVSKAAGFDGSGIHFDRMIEILDALSIMYLKGLSPGDTERTKHWGKTPDGRIVLLDYGLTDKVWSDHYGP